ncbi:putative mycofactocin radical SAM maturase MftC [Geobacter sp. OR-1]|uniref:radical SAM/SPASM domain-containing protein n=1 Tax=Geobacter sp. OR-1 TaxID=1266765 RepID=UPI000542FD21|nr:radical SAM/SPASM domain-containing protein [Geobacter sp. OR-1]GAM09649.1 putative mycofactocin radical SAM maturase MftC [Geobacter sp. OR-1]
MQLWTKEENDLRITQIERSRKRRELKVAHTPYRLRIEPTNLCNLACTCCPNTINRPQEVGFIDINLFKEIIAQAGCFKNRVNLYLYLGGEPLLHNQLVAMINYAADYNITTTFNTNGALLTKELAEELLDSQLYHISFSFDDMTPDQYESLRKNSKYEKVLNNIRYMLKRKQELGKLLPAISIESLATFEPSFRSSIDINSPLECSAEFIALFEGLGVNYFQKNYAHSWAGGYDLSNGEIKLTGLQPLAATSQKTATVPCCIFPWKEMVINFKGDVVACCYDLGYATVLGSVTKASLDQIWNNKNYQRFREMHIRKKLHALKPCSTCAMLKGEVLA